MAQTLLFVCSVILCLLKFVSCTVVTVCPTTDTENCRNGVDINQALGGVTTNTELVLHPGVHVLSSYHLIANVSGVSFTGQASNGSDVVVRCVNGTGLAFFGVDSLTLSNFVLDGCGVNDVNIKDTLQLLKDTFESVVIIPAGLDIALFLADSQDVTLDHITIGNTTGIGMLGINIEGIIANTTFLNNHYKQCGTELFDFDVTYEEYIGGGVYLLYQDYKSGPSNQQQNVVVTDSLFVNNSDCSLIGEVASAIQYSSTLQEIGYTAGGGGGLTVIMSQLHFGVSVEVISSRFEGNVAKFGSGTHVGIFSGVTDSSIIFTDCQFDRNGLQFGPSVGGAMAVIIDLVRPTIISQRDFLCPLTSQRNLSITLSDVLFRDNRAQFSGGVTIYSLHADGMADNSTHILLQRCVFERNIAFSSVSTLSVYENKYVGLDPGVQTILEDCTFIDNTIERNLTGPDNVVIGSETILAVIHSRLTLIGRNYFNNNVGSALTGISAPIYVYGHVIITGNIAALGGGMKLIEQSFLVLQNHSTIELVNNSAAGHGGGIYVYNIFTFTNDDCFIHLERFDRWCHIKGDCLSPMDINATIKFEGNRANVGSMIFGSTLESCPWVTTSLKVDPDMTLYQNLHHNPNISLFVFDKEPVGAGRVSTASNNIVPDIGSLEPVMPGQRFTLQLTSFDRFQQPIPDSLTSVVADQNLSLEFDSKLGESGYWFLDGTPEGSNVPTIVVGQENETRNLFIVSTEPGSSGATGVVIHLTPCLVGYIYNESSGHCYCDPMISGANVQCSVDTRSFTVPRFTWFGPLEDAKEGERSNEVVLATGQCPFDFCKTGPNTIVDGDFDLQCTEGHGRTGVLCGACKEGLSLTIGLSKCSKCSNYYLFLIVVYMILGVLLILGMAFARITITEGYLNPVLFYSNILLFYDIYLVPRSLSTAVLAPVGFLSLFPKFGVCLFNGSTALLLIIVQHASILYLYILMGLVRLVSHFVNLPGAEEYSPVKVFATLLLLCYVSFIQLSVLSLAFTEVRTITGDLHLRWFLDPTVPYFEGLHAFICVIAILILLVYAIPLPLLTLFPQYLYNFKYFGRMKPLYDAIWAPFKTKYRWWFSFRLIMRWVPLTFIVFLDVPYNLLALGIFLVLLLSIQQAIAPFKDYWQNALDNFLMTNLILLVVGALFFHSAGNETQHIIYISLVLSAAYIIFIVVFLRHMYLRWSDKWNQVVAFVKKHIEKPFKSKKEVKEGETNSQNPKIVVESTAIEPQVNMWQRDKDIAALSGYQSPPGPHIVSFTEFREPLLDDEGEIEVITSFAALDSDRRVRSVEFLNHRAAADNENINRHNEKKERIETTV